MFNQANWGNPETLMLNVTNLAMGLFTLWLLLGFLWSCLQEWLHQGKASV